MDEAPTRRSGLRGWWVIIGLVSAFLTVVLTVGWLWYRSTADLEAIRSEAKTLGIPVTWANTGLTVSPPDVIAMCERIGALSSSLKDYDSLAIVSTPKTDRLKAYLPIPQAAVDHHARLDPTIVTEFLDLIDRLPQQPVVLVVERTFASKYPEIGWARQVVRYLGERILLAPPDQVAHEVGRMLRFLGSRDNHSLIELLEQTSCIQIALERIAGRLTELNSKMPDLAARLDHLAALVDSTLINALIGEFVIANHSVEHVDEIAVSMSTSFSAWDRLALRPMTRIGRESLLRHELAWIQFAQRHPPPSDLIAFAKVLRVETQSLRTWMPNEALTKMLMGAMPFILESAAICRVRLQVMVAELRSQPWPIDPYDPSGGTLRRIERDGVLHGAYTIYENGIDDGGDKKKDRYFPLYGPLEPPVSARP